MRYLAVGLAALLLSVPALAAAGGPDALSIAKRALALAKEPPQVFQTTTVSREFHGREVTVRARCPHGSKAMGFFPEFGGHQAEFLSAELTSPHAAYALFRIPESASPIGSDPWPTITLTCIEG